LKFIMYRFIVCVAVVLFMHCASPVLKVEMELPEAGRSIVVGAILVENDGIDDLYQAKTSNTTVVVVGRHTQDGKEVSDGYRLKTDKNGYFFIPNVPPGAYVLKGIEVDVGFTNRMMISSRWEGNSQVYIPADYMIDYTVRVWPDEVKEPVIDMGIHYFKLDHAGRIYHDQFVILQNAVLGLKGIRHTMARPKKYYENLYPESKWFE